MLGLHGDDDDVGSPFDHAVRRYGQHHPATAAFSLSINQGIRISWVVGDAPAIHVVHGINGDSLDSVAILKNNFQASNSFLFGKDVIPWHVTAFVIEFPRAPVRITLLVDRLTGNVFWAVRFGRTVGFATQRCFVLHVHQRSF